MKTGGGVLCVGAHCGHYLGGLDKEARPEVFLTFLSTNTRNHLEVIQPFIVEWKLRGIEQQSRCFFLSESDVGKVLESYLESLILTRLGSS